MLIVISSHHYNLNSMLSKMSTLYLDGITLLLNQIYVPLLQELHGTMGLKSGLLYIVTKNIVPWILTGKPHSII